MARQLLGLLYKPRLVIPLVGTTHSSYNLLVLRPNSPGHKAMKVNIVSWLYCVMERKHKPYKCPQHVNYFQVCFIPIRAGSTWISGVSTHWGRLTHICVGKLTISGSDSGLSPERHQAIIWTNAGILLIGPLGTNFREILIENQTFSLKKIRLKMSSAKCCSFRLGLNVLKYIGKSIELPICGNYFSDI